MMDFSVRTSANHRPMDGKDDLFQAHEGLGRSSIDKVSVATVSPQLRTMPQPMDALHSSAPPPFLTKTYDMVDDPATNEIVSWSSTDNSFVVWNPPEFSRDLIPKFFKHNNFSSFVRQLNTYGFRKVDPDRWEFANEGFLRGERQLLKSIQRRKPAQSSQSQQQAGQGPKFVEVGKFGGMEGELERLKRDKNVLMLELVRMRQQQQAAERELHVMGQRLHVTEQRQGQMMSFLAKAMQNPTFLAQLMHPNDALKRFRTVTKKRRLPKQEIEVAAGVSGTSTSGGQDHRVKYEVAWGSEHVYSMLVEFFNSSDASTKLDAPSNLSDRRVPEMADQKAADGEEEEDEEDDDEYTITEIHGSTKTGIAGSSQLAFELENYIRSQVETCPNGVARNSASDDVVGGRSKDLLPVEMGFASETEDFQYEDGAGAGGNLHNVLGMSDIFWGQILGGNLDSADSETDADGEKSSVEIKMGMEM
ncbi:hypothetical protein O6H91_10G076400 [Diphasiastrum complanatum]|uniref:Uncharacterized protein n=1 Tax=Diphasiastrum complanatum TaxID=34168 RepID=A0ACC2CIA7_DIPCM|nr:hypothetical protein O6H91_10G076400 [Diphasiastrum complanatum]